MTAADARWRRRRSGRGGQPGIRVRPPDPAIGPAPPRRFRGRQVGAERAGQAGVCSLEVRGENFGERCRGGAGGLVEGWSESSAGLARGGASGSSWSSISPAARRQGWAPPSRRPVHRWYSRPEATKGVAGSLEGVFAGSWPWNGARYGTRTRGLRRGRPPGPWSRGGEAGPAMILEGPTYFPSAGARSLAMARASSTTASSSSSAFIRFTILPALKRSPTPPWP